MRSFFDKYFVFIRHVHFSHKLFVTDTNFSLRLRLRLRVSRLKLGQLRLESCLHSLELFVVQEVETIDVECEVGVLDAHRVEHLVVGLDLRLCEDGIDQSWRHGRTGCHVLAKGHDHVEFVSVEEVDSSHNLLASQLCVLRDVFGTNCIDLSLKLRALFIIRQVYVDRLHVDFIGHFQHFEKGMLDHHDLLLRDQRNDLLQMHKLSTISACNSSTTTGNKFFELDLSVVRSEIIVNFAGRQELFPLHCAVFLVLNLSERLCLSLQC